MFEAVGRYAPSPTGPLHIGSLIAAVASFCQARAQGGRWLLRIDDLDRPRVVAGADRRLLETLTAFGLPYDGMVLYQSQRTCAYAAAINRLRAEGWAFDCGCTRREALSGPLGVEGRIYPGTCRDGLPTGREARSVRLRVAETPIEVVDLFQGRYAQKLARDVGDFVIRRADGIVAYQLATVIDDAEQGVTEVIRGADLLSSTPRQIAIQRCLGLSTPAYGHIPVMVDECGAKMGKSVGALALDPRQRQAQLLECLTLLGQLPPESLMARSVDGVMRWAVDNWAPEAVPQRAECRRLPSASGA